MSRKSLELIPCTIGGSPTHYYHFLLGFIVPLLEQQEFIWNQNGHDLTSVPTLGPMNHLLEELELPRLQITSTPLSRGVLSKLLCRWLGRQGINLHIPCGNFHSKMFLPGRDRHFRYDREVFQKTKKRIQGLLDKNWERARQRVARDFAAAPMRILIVQRGAAPNDDPDRNSFRRSVPNMADIVAAIDSVHGRCVVKELENCSLAEQIALFDQAEVVVAQHGAGLANLIWAKPPTKVVEIYPSTIERKRQRFNHFGYLSQCMRLEYRRVQQAGDHSPVPAHLILDALAQLGCRSLKSLPFD